MWNSAPGPTRPGRRRLLCALPALLAWPEQVRARSVAGVPLHQQLPRTLAGCGLPSACLGLFVAGVGSGRPVAELNGEQAFVMASTAKIVTSLAALDLLGARWRWRTHAFATGPVNDGRLLGDLLIMGGGDPRLSSAELRQWLQGLRAQGLSEVRGDLVVDRSAFHLHEHDHAGTPPPSPRRPHHARPDALSLDAGGHTATDAVAALWREVGGRLLGRVREAEPGPGGTDQMRLPVMGPDGEPMWPLSTHLSPTLTEVVHEINKTSNNLAARHLMLSLARGFPARPATLAAARERLHAWLLRQGLAPGDIELDNGSGLSRAERSKPRALVALLRQGWSAAAAGVFVDSLPVAGVDGTLAHRLQGGAAHGQAFLKTGSLLDARALAGYVRSRSGTVHAVAMFVNHPDAARATPAIDAVIESLARLG